MSTRKTSSSKPHWIICWWTHLPSLIATMLAHAFSTPTKVTEYASHVFVCLKSRYLSFVYNQKFKSI
jgi:hypothetical protein